MTDGDALFASILASPDEDTPRLVYADWLEENGQHARAEFIRVQIELARIIGNNHYGTVPGIPADNWKYREMQRRDLLLRQLTDINSLSLLAAEKTLLAKHGEYWISQLRRGGPLGKEDTHAQFRRGFVEIIWMPAQQFLSHAERLFQLCPIRELRVTRVSQDELQELVTCLFVRMLETLDLSNRGIGRTIPQLLSVSRFARFLKVVRLRGCGLTNEGAQILANVPYEWPLRELDVTYNPIGSVGLAALRNRFGTAVRTNE